MFNRIKKLSPPRIIALGFITLIFLGAFLLMLPVSLKEGQSINFIDALYTSTSAVCVTGLVVVDTSATYTYFGRTVIMLLIQCGGLGIMIFASVIYGFLRRKMSISNMLLMREALNQDSMSYLAGTISGIVKLAISIESIGAFILSFRYIPRYGILKGIYYSVFHSVSAFCNAGFDIAPGEFTSIVEYVSDPVVVITTAMLIVVGGTGFAVIHEVLNFKKNKKLSLHARVVLGSTIILIAIGTVSFVLLERNNPNTMADMPLGTQILSGFFQSVTTRTAGYNTIDQNGMTMASKLLSIILMFIGASPASTGGGIKTTTFCIMFMACYSVITGKDDVEFKYRRVSIALALKAFVITTIMLTMILISSTLVMIFEGNVPMDAVFYEVFSAAATVGLSLGITPTLSTASKLVLVFTMFAGRVGPLTLTMALAGTRDKKKLVRNIESSMMIG